VDANNPEVRQQLYGGEIADYYPLKNKQASPEEDMKQMGDIYQQMLNKNNPLNLPATLKNKISILKSL
jgi:hypothetical protein